MDHDNRTLARSKPTLPAGAPRVLLTAVAEQVTVFAETTKPVTLIGSRRDCDLSIGQSDVSKIHCALVNTGTSIVVTDLCTRSGTFVNGQPVSVAPLHPGDELRVGSEPVAVWFPEPGGDSASPSAQEHPAKLEQDHPLRLTGVRQSHELLTLPAVIGRRSTCSIVLDTPDVSLTHALLLSIEGRPAIYDLGSRSGTYLNGQRVGLAWLSEGDELSIGGEKLSLTSGSLRELPAEAAPDADSAVSFAGTKGGAGGVLGDAPPFDPGPARSEEERISSRMPVLESLAALAQREVSLDEREAKLAAAERELACRQAELAERETTNAEAITRIAAFVGAVSEAWRAFGFELGPPSAPGESSPPLATRVMPEPEFVDSTCGDADQSKSRDALRAPAINQPRSAEPSSLE